MISDEEILELPEDPELAFVAFEEKLRSFIRNEETNQNNGLSELYMEYMNKIVAAANVFGVVNICDYPLPEPEDVYPGYRQFVSLVDNYTMRVRLKSVRRVKKFSVKLDSAAKLTIRHWINQIREAVDKLEISEEKREALYDRLSDLETELDKGRTRIDALGALWITLCGYTGAGVEKLEPIRKWIDSISGLMGQVQSLENGNPKIAPPVKPKQIEPPRQNNTVDTIDDPPF